MGKSEILHLSRAALIAASFIQPQEGFRTHAYFDPPGIVTICYGHTGGIKMGQVASKAQCAVFLNQDTAKAESVFNAYVVPETVNKISDQSKAAFLSFIFNTGSGTFSTSSARRDLNKGDIEAACNDLPKDVCYRVPPGTGARPGATCGNKKRDHAVLADLERRRAAEKELCLGGLTSWFSF